MSTEQNQFSITPPSNSQENSPVQNKKNISFIEIYQLIKKMNLDYNKTQTLEIIQELGMGNSRESIQLDNLIQKSRVRRSSSKYADFYENVLNLFITPSERILKILEDCKEKLSFYKEEKLVEGINWVMKKIQNDDIYNLNTESFFDEMNELKNLVMAGDTNIAYPDSEMENIMKFFAEYSSDAFTKNKKEDLKTVKNLSDKRMQSNLNKSPMRKAKTLNERNMSVYIADPISIMNNYSISPENFQDKNIPKKSIAVDAFKININMSPLSKGYSSEKNNIKEYLSNSIGNTKFDIIKEEEDLRVPQVTDFNINNIKNSHTKTETNSNANSHPRLSNFNLNDEEYISEKKVLNDLSKSNYSSLSNKTEEKDKQVNFSSLEKNATVEFNPNDPSDGDVNDQGNLKNQQNLCLEINRQYTKEAEFIQINDHNSPIDDINFNIFQYSEKYPRDQIFSNISEYIFDRYSLFCVINSKRFETFLAKIRVGYDYLLPYHNDLHAVDVLQTSHVFCILADLKNSIDLTSLDLSAFFIACIIHDFKHPGLNNNYHINKRSTIATKYNDISVLENYHVSSAFKIMTHPNSNIFCDLSVEEYRVARKRIVECVLSTDMAKHAKAQTSLKIKIDQFKNKSQQESILVKYVLTPNEETKFDRQQEILNYLIHMADISNPGKIFSISKTWTDLVMEEFFNQGDLEKSEKLNVSFLCDRETTNIPKSQVMFISNIVLPAYKLLVQLIPKCSVFVQNMYDNIKMWEKEEERYKEESENKLES
jgi:hypothetical protein